MISFIALLIALLTLVGPGTPPANRNASDVHPLREASGEGKLPSANEADSHPDLRPLLGAWRATVTFAAGESEVTDLEIARDPSRPSEVRSAVLSFGPAEERFRGTLTATSDGAELVFASQATCDALHLGSATITGRLQDQRLEGTAFLPDQHHLVSWSAERLG